MKLMSKLLVFSMLSLMVLGIVQPAVSHAAPVTPSGSGTEADPYLISSVGHLEWMSDEVNMNENTFDGMYFTLMNDIDASSWNATPIGGVSYANDFNGVFDGNGKKITNLTIDIDDAQIGLFGGLGIDGEIKDLGLENVDISGGQTVGALVGINRGKVINSYSSGSVKGLYGVGGLVGSVFSGSVVDSHSMATVESAGIYAGGLAGINNSLIENSYASGTVTAENFVGGLVGENLNLINNSHATGSVDGDEYVGGLIGSNSGGEVVNSYATGSVQGKSEVGGLVGKNNGSVKNSYSIGNVTGNISVGGLVGTNETDGNGSVEGKIINSYSSGGVNGSASVGGAVGNLLSGEVENLYWDTDSDFIVADDPVAPKMGVGSGVDVSIGKTSTEMRTAGFVTLLNSNRNDGAEWFLDSGVNDGFPTFNVTGASNGGGSSEGGSGDQNQDISIIGNVSSTLIIVTVPTSISFAINPNSASDPFISAPFSIENHSNSPVEVSFLGFQSDTGTSAKIVNEDKYTDWSKLSTSKSESEIALGINVDGNVIWSPAEHDGEAPDTVVDTINIDRLGLKGLNLAGRHGMAFSESKLMSYKMYIRVGLAS